MKIVLHSPCAVSLILNNKKTVSQIQIYWHCSQIVDEVVNFVILLVLICHIGRIQVWSGPTWIHGSQDVTFVMFKMEWMTHIIPSNGVTSRRPPLRILQKYCTCSHVLRVCCRCVIMWGTSSLSLSFLIITQTHISESAALKAQHMDLINPLTSVGWTQCVAAVTHSWTSCINDINQMLVLSLVKKTVVFFQLIIKRIYSPISSGQNHQPLCCFHSSKCHSMCCTPSRTCERRCASLL